MKWKSQKGRNSIRPNGSYRIFRKFLWFPKSIGESVRWLCYANILQRWFEYEDGVARWSSEGWVEGSPEEFDELMRLLNEQNTNNRLMKRW